MFSKVQELLSKQSINAGLVLLLIFFGIVDGVSVFIRRDYWDKLWNRVDSYITVYAENRFNSLEKRILALETAYANEHKGQLPVVIFNNTETQNIKK